MNPETLLLVVAAVLAGCAAFNVNSPLHLGWASVCVFFVSFLV